MTPMSIDRLGCDIRATVAMSQSSQVDAGMDLAVLSGGRDTTRLPLPLIVIALCLFVPQELSFFVGDLRFTVERLVLIVLTPAIFAALLQKLACRNCRFVVADLFVPLAAFWMFLGPAVTFDVEYSLRHSGPIVLEFLITYASTRVLLSGHGMALRFIDVLSILIAFVAMDAVFDTLSGAYVTRELCARITGYGMVHYNADSYRLGMLRAMGPMEHPILFGFICAIGFLLAVSVRVRWRIFCAVTSLGGLLISLSSAPQQCAVMGIALIYYCRMLRGRRGKWYVIWTPISLLAVVLFLSTDTPFGHLIQLFTIDPQTAYYRLYIWSIVGPAVLQNPLFTVPSTDYDYQGSIDSVWLVLSVEYGLPCSILTGLSMIGACSLPIEAPRARLLPEEEKLGITLTIVIILTMYMGVTVDFWGSTWILVGLLVGVRAHIGELGAIAGVSGRQAA
jgi:hypothetical protein